METLVQIQGLTKKYGRVVALDNISIDLPKGRIIGLLGPNGSGKTTLIKVINGLLQPDSGAILIGGEPVGLKSKSMVAYLPDRTYLSMSSSVQEILQYFEDFYADFNREKAEAMLASLQIEPKTKLKSMSKGTKEKVQLVLVMSREAQLYILDEPIAGVDPAARDFILRTIITNYNPEATVLISTHLISDIEQVLDDAIFLQNGRITMANTVDNIREQEGKSVDELFREVFKC